MWKKCKTPCVVILPVFLTKKIPYFITDTRNVHRLLVAPLIPHPFDPFFSSSIAVRFNLLERKVGVCFISYEFLCLDQNKLIIESNHLVLQEFSTVLVDEADKVKER